MALLKQIATVGSYTMASRLLGFARDILIAATLGAGPIADAFFVAFKLPNFFRRLFAEGAFNAAFVPLFVGVQAGRGAAPARAFAEQVLSLLVTVLLGFVAVFEIAMPVAMYAFAPGFAADAAKFDLAVALTRLTFPYLLFISLVSALGAMLNALDRFSAAAATPILLNLILIGALLGLAPLTETPGHALAIGVSLAGMGQFLWLILACRRAGLRLALPRPRLSPGVMRLLRRMVPAAIGAGAVQINLLVDVIIASFLPTGAVSYLYYADRVNQLPIGVIGVAVGTALLPLLSRQLRTGREAEAMASFNRATEFALLLTLPAAAALVVVADPIVVVLFQRGAFDAAAAAAAGEALAAYAVGLPAYVLIKVLGPAFFAREDTVTPVKVAGLCVAANLALNLILVVPLAHVGIALATAISAWLNAAALALVLHRRGHLRIDHRLRRRAPRIVLSAALMAGGLVAAQAALWPALDNGLGGRAGALAALVVGGMALFGAAAQLAGAANIRELRGLMRRRPS